MEVIQKTTLAKAFEIDEDKCLNCHACISVCPVKYCNNGSDDIVTVNTDMCIACGKCIDACTHEARKFIDDFDLLLADLKKGEKIIAIVPPAIAASFPNTYLNLNTWLKEIGIEFIYDVSFGAELTVKSYLDHIETNQPKTVIAQPCPAIVTYIQLYKPELIKHLAPTDSPMLHSIKMIKNYYPEYSNYKVAIISPCLAKKREFEETQIGDYLIAIKSIDTHLKNNGIEISSLTTTDFDNPKAERATLFSSPGGLLKTAERWSPEIVDKSRKIEGVESIYEYLDSLPDAIEKGVSPLIVDCLNCENGCNTGPLTTTKNKTIDEIEYSISNRSIAHKKQYMNGNGNTKEIEAVVNKYWEKGLYNRTYKNLWQNVELKYPNSEELNNIFVSMHKYSDEDIYNCVSCGYNSCEKMATAIFNGLNKPENCHYYLQTETDRSKNKIQKNERRVNNILESAHDGFVQLDTEFVIQQANLAFKAMVKRNDVQGRSLLEFLDLNNQEILKQHGEKRRNNEKSSYELELIQTDEAIVNCLISGAPMPDENDNIIGSFAMISDITELKKAESELRESHENLEQKVIERTEELNEMLEELRVSNEMVNSYNRELEKLSIVASEIDNATIIMDTKGNFEWVNTGFTRMFGLSNEQVKGKNIISKSTPDYIKEKIEEAIKHGRTVSYEFEQTTPASNTNWIQATLTPIKNKKGEVYKIIAIDSDITALKQKEFEILSQKEEIESQRDSIEKQRDIAKRQSDNIQASITYASRIQNALLPSKELFKQYFKEHFIIYYPKDIVSGDFYWICEKNNKVYVVGADCTGHGVPGAFMSMLGITQLNEIVNGQCDGDGDIKADTILNRLRSNIISSLNQTAEKKGAKDGMDAALCIFDFEKNEMEFAGANLPVFIVRNGEIIEIKGDRMPVGIYRRRQDNFIKHNITLEKNDQIYLFSDGVTDMFNGVNKQKLTRKRFKELLLSFEKLPMKDQYLRFNTAFDVWQGNKNQVDDILLIGLKI